MSATRLLRAILAGLVGGCIALAISAPSVLFSAVLLAVIAFVGYVVAWRLDELP